MQFLFIISLFLMSHACLNTTLICCWNIFFYCCFGVTNIDAHRRARGVGDYDKVLIKKTNYKNCKKTQSSLALLNFVLKQWTIPHEICFGKLILYFKKLLFSPQRSNQTGDFESIIKCVQILAFSILLVHSYDEESSQVLPYLSLTANVKRLISIEHIAGLDSLLLTQSR